MSADESTTDATYPDYREFRPAVTQAHLLQPFGQLLADAGYESEVLHKFCREELGVVSIIATTRRGRPPHDGSKSHMTGGYSKQIYKRFPRKAFGQRWQVENAFSQEKHRSGWSYAAATSDSESLFTTPLSSGVASINVFSTEHICRHLIPIKPPYAVRCLNKPVIGCRGFLSPFSPRLQHSARIRLGRRVTAGRRPTTSTS